MQQTPNQIKHRLRQQGYTLKSWAEANGFKYRTVSDVVRGLISVKRGDNGIMYFQMLSMTFKQLELQKLKLEAMKQPGKMRKYSFMLLGCFLLMYLGVLGYVVLEAFGDLF